MSSLARRGLRTTVAAAGLAALGMGLAGPAYASPDAPAAEPEATETTPAAPAETDEEETDGAGTEETDAAGSGAEETDGSGSAEDDMLADVAEDDAPEAGLFEVPDLFAFQVPTSPAGGLDDIGDAPEAPGTDLLDVDMPDPDDSTIGEGNAVEPAVPGMTTASAGLAEPSDATSMADEMAQMLFDATNDNNIVIPPAG